MFMDFESAWKKTFKWKSQNMPKKIIDTVSLDMCMGHNLSRYPRVKWNTYRTLVPL